MKTEPYRNRGFFLKTEPKSTDLAKYETVTTLVNTKQIYLLTPHVGPGGTVE